MKITLVILGTIAIFIQGVLVGSASTTKRLKAKEEARQKMLTKLRRNLSKELDALHDKCLPPDEIEKQYRSDLTFYQIVFKMSK